MRTALVLAVPIACLVWTFTQEEIFREFRDTLKTYQREHGDSFWRKKLAYLPTCPYCFSHYVTIVFLGLFRFRMLVSDWRGYVVSLFTLVLIANVYITAYNMLRAALRASKAIADRAEAHADEARRLSKPMEAWKPRDMAVARPPSRKGQRPIEAAGRSACRRAERRWIRCLGPRSVSRCQRSDMTYRTLNLYTVVSR